MTPLWLDLPGGALPAAGQERDVGVCGYNTFLNDCCAFKGAARIRNCGSYFIYRLRGAPLNGGVCMSAYCAE